MRTHLRHHVASGRACLPARRSSTLCFAAALAFFAGGCDDDAYRDAPLAQDASTVLPEGDGGVATNSAELRCNQAIASEPLPAREALITGGGATGTQGIYVQGLMAEFTKVCSPCHTDGASNGGYTVNMGNFADQMSDHVLSRIRSDDPKVYMPVGSDGKPFSERSATDPVVVFARHLEQWLDEGKPSVIFPAEPEGNGGSDAGTAEASSPYRPSFAVGMGMTNIGNCVPSGRFDNGAARVRENKTLDAKFAAISSFSELPKQLSETDLTSLDSEELAKRGIYAYAPAYTLWADNAKKVRYIRVPVGTSVEFDADQQAFNIPDNTRIYKTFAKRVVDIRGNVRYRKIETRLIVTRTDAERVEGADYVPAAIFGTYRWNDAETEATLVDQPYRDGNGFKDQVFNVLIDEQLEDQVLREHGDDLDMMLETGARRTYALPGSDRCVHCHMGAPGSNFVLGFTPLQIHRRPLGEGGVIEPAEAHELDQLDRFIAYGLVTGLSSAEEIVTLEDSQPGRAPRNEHELNAQGYLLGNCAHCHNPRGFPSARERSLVDILNFEPGDMGGVFRYPLTHMSPRTFRGPDQNIQTPYITPSLFDHPLAVRANKVDLGPRALKWITEVPALGANPEEVVQSAPDADTFPNVDVLELKPGRPLYAPWRSLIYRNVDAPFSYEDGATIFPHMPMDTPGYDCRARRVLGSWMASIPAKLTSGLSGDFGEMSDPADQPYEEVLPEDPDYDRYSAEAEQRRARFENGDRYQDCPDAKLDTLSPVLVGGIPPFQREVVSAPTQDTPGESYELLSPARPHYFDTDMRDLPTWTVRRERWFEILVETGVDPDKNAVGGETAKNSERTIGIVRSLKLGDHLAEVLLAERPLALWEAKSSCAAKLAAVPTAGSYVGAARPHWMELTKPADDAPVYTGSIGGQVFNAVCSKCHGPDATGKSALANTIADLRGGTTRVANLRDGLFGPVGSPGQNARTEFVKADGRLGASAEDWTARYLVWMGLGGTTASIPRTVLTQIGSAKVFGVARKGSLGVIDPSSAANMLGVVAVACGRVFPAEGIVVFDGAHGRLQRARKEPGNTLRSQSALEDRALVATNADAELWETVCSLDNLLPIRMVTIDSSDPNSPQLQVEGATFPLEGVTPPVVVYKSLFKRSAWPAGQPIGDHRGNTVASLDDSNLAPWCVQAEASQEAALASIEKRLGKSLPRCPRGLNRQANSLTEEEGKHWTTRGAANAGLAVYYYLKGIADGSIAVKPAYDRCEDL
jgi:hypothetical protein